MGRGDDTLYIRHGAIRDDDVPGSHAADGGAGRDDDDPGTRTGAVCACDVWRPLFFPLLLLYFLLTLRFLL